MYLKGVEIVNYKNLKNCYLNFSEGVNTIIGENDSGKSNIINAIRILLDDTYYYSTKRLKENDFSYDLDDWKGHWIIISAIFSNISQEELNNEICSEIKNDENINFVNSYIGGEDNTGVITLFIRPQKTIRKELSIITEKEEFKKRREKIKISDYEFYYTYRATTDFCDEKVYKEIVGDIDNFSYKDPDDDDDSILGAKLNILDIQNHISVVFIDALRDALSEMHKPRNPIKRIIESIESEIDPEKIDKIQKLIANLNLSISEVEQIKEIGGKINSKLLDMIGMVYSPQILLESQLNDDINALTRYLTIKPSNQNSIELLGLGHLNMIYIALKLVEFETNRTRELLNIMLIEEPEAHIHPHIQKTLFENLKVTKNYTQVIMTTHSTHLSEVSDINKMNIIKSKNNISIIMNPVNKLDTFGKEKLELKKMALSKCIERYLDAKRSVLLFSKGIILVEGDGEEILIPNMVKKAFGISLDELGVSIINIGSTAFENIACLFDEQRIKKNCSIITDLDKQYVLENSSHYSKKAEKLGESRKEKLNNLFDDNNWVNCYYADSTFEIEFIKEKQNITYVKDSLDEIYKRETDKTKHISKLEGELEDAAESILIIAEGKGKGWYATILSNIIDKDVIIPDYIRQAIAHACKEVIDDEIKIKMIKYVLNSEKISEKCKTILELIEKREQNKLIIEKYCAEFSNTQLSKFLKEIEEDDAR